ncbi:MAG: hypothetical protein QM784_30270 [Polyangiaceae bacterium]
MKSRTIVGLLTLCSAGALVLYGCDTKVTCEDNENCPAGGSASLGGSSSRGGKSSVGGESGGGGATSAGGTTSTTAPCNGSCSGSTPVCNETSNKCVACLANTDCKDATKSVCNKTTFECVGCLASSDCSKDATKPVCDLAKTTCVGCLGNTDCSTATASRCDTASNSCTACQADSDCSQIAGKGVCSAGTCVQCTPEKETACGANSCNPKTKTCTSTARNSVGLCGACLADSECATGTGVTVARCIDMTFGSSAAPHGSYCLEAVSSGCEQPFDSTSVMKITKESVSGAPVADYCGVNQERVTCEAILDMKDASNTIRCTNPTSTQPDDTLCGCPRDASGKCTEPGKGGLCRAIGSQNRCTIQCGSGGQCASGYTCISLDTPNYCG